MIPVAVYCRVSTDREDQHNSFEAQQRYFREHIASHPDWTLYEIYADEGITGTSTRRRSQFNRMIRDAHEGKFRLILTKEVSRFSRNILDTIRYTRQLKDLGIGVIFAADRISTLEPEAEMLLSFLATLAQEESRRTSSRVTWGQTRQMERGVVFGRSLLGYEVSAGKITVEPEGAETVRLIFHKYALEQLSAARIAEYLRRQQLPTGSGSTFWTANAVLKILRNEKYAGDLVQKKTYTPDYLTHARKQNRGEVPLVTISDHHEPLISREIWNITRERLAQNNRHRKGSGAHSTAHAFSGKIFCGQCGAAFVARWKYRKDGTKVRRWSCGTAARKGAGSCPVGKLLREDDALQMLKTVLCRLPWDREAIITQATDLALGGILAKYSQEAGIRYARKILLLQQKKENMMDSHFSGHISAEEMLAMKKRYDTRMETLRKQQEKAEDCHRNRMTLRRDIQREVTDILSMEKGSDVLCKNLLDSITVFQDRHLELRLKGMPMVFHFLG